MTDARRAELFAEIHHRNLARLAEDDLDPADAAAFLAYLDRETDRVLATAQGMCLLFGAATDGRQH